MNISIFGGHLGGHLGFDATGQNFEWPLDQKVLELHPEPLEKVSCFHHFLQNPPNSCYKSAPL